MNSANKQHRHPGLWSLPVNSGRQDIAEFPQLVAPNQPQYSGIETSAESILPRQLAEAFTRCANDNQLTGRWVTIIGHPCSMSATQLASLIDASGLPAHRVRWLRPGDSDSKAWATEQALLLDNSALIIAWLGQCHSRDARRLHLARRHTRANTLLFTEPAEKTPLH